MEMKKKIWICSDDGIYSAGLDILERFVSSNINAETTIIAPRFDMSGKTDLTISTPIRVYDIQEYEDAIVTDGSLADTVRVAIAKERSPDFVFVGINSEPNIGKEVFHSGSYSVFKILNFLGYDFKGMMLSKYYISWTETEMVLNFMKKEILRLYEVKDCQILNVVLNGLVLRKVDLTDFEYFDPVVKVLDRFYRLIYVPRNKLKINNEELNSLNEGVSIYSEV